MAYCLHIQHAEMTEEEEPVPILLEEWRAAVAATEGVRLFAGEVRILDIPGHVIRSPATEGDAEVWFLEDRQWYWAFRWEGGWATFTARFAPGDMSHPVWAAAVSMASRLGAVIRGDEGEIYDCKPGRPVPRLVSILAIPIRSGRQPSPWLLAWARCFVAIKLSPAICKPDLRWTAPPFRDME